MHMLVVGATGMLREATLFFNKQGNQVSTISKTKYNADALRKAAKNQAKLNTILVDWDYPDELIEKVAAAVEKYGEISQIVLWMHSKAEETMTRLLQYISSKATSNWEIYHIKGSIASRPDKNWIPNLPHNCLYKEIILGFKIEDERSRWLTNQEISQGVVEAVEGKMDRKIIGVIEPWTMRPGW